MLGSFPGGFHQQEEGLSFWRRARAIKCGRATYVLHVPEGINLAVNGGAHFVRSVSVVCRQPRSANAAIDRIGEHLRQIGFDKSVRLIDHIMEQAILTLMCQTPIQDFPHVVCKRLLFRGP